MSPSGEPEFDSYFVPVDKAKWAPPEDEEIRFRLLPAKADFHVAGTAVMILAAAIFVIFGISVSAMLHEAGEPEGLLFDED